MQWSESWMRRAASVGCAILTLFSAVDAAGAQEPATALAQGRDIVELPGVGRVILVFLLVAGIAVAIAFALRRYSPALAGGFSPNGPLRVVDRSTLNAGLRVHLIEVDGERVVVAENRAGVSLLQLRRQVQTHDQGSSS